MPALTPVRSFIECFKRLVLEMGQTIKNNMQQLKLVHNESTSQTKKMRMCDDASEFSHMHHESQRKTRNVQSCEHEPAKQFMAQVLPKICFTAKFNSACRSLATSQIRRSS